MKIEDEGINEEKKWYKTSVKRRIEIDYSTKLRRERKK